MTDKLYDARPVDEDWLMDHFTKHQSAMTAEGLHDKADIAAELAWRDYLLELEKRETARARERSPEDIEAMRIIREAARLLKDSLND